MNSTNDVIIAYWHIFDKLMSSPQQSCYLRSTFVITRTPPSSSDSYHQNIIIYNIINKTHSKLVIRVTRTIFSSFVSCSSRASGYGSTPAEQRFVRTQSADEALNTVGEIPSITLGQVILGNHVDLGRY